MEHWHSIQAIPEMIWSKCTWLTKELILDNMLLITKLKIFPMCWKYMHLMGIDSYFENVGGHTSSIISGQTRSYGSIQ